MLHKGQGIRCRYDGANMEQALRAVLSHTLSIRQAAERFNVPKSTLHDRCIGKVQPGAVYGKKPIFSQDVERQIANSIKDAAHQGFGITRSQLMVKAGKIARDLNLKTPFKNGIPGDEWLAGFLKRNPDISLRQPMPLTSRRMKCLNRQVITQYFNDLEKLIVNLGLTSKPNLIWNMDENNVSITHKPSKVLAQKGARNIPGRVSDCRESVSVLACIGAAGQEVPPMAIVKGKTPKVLNAYNTAEGVWGSKYTYQERAWMEDALGELWFREHFLKFCGPERPQLILLDSHSSHETLGLLEAARANNIAIFAFPPHTTHWLCPLDKSVFSPFEKEYGRVCSNFSNSSPNNIVCKWEWPRLFRDAHDRSFTPLNLKSGFRACGIFPFNPSAIPDTAFCHLTVMISFQHTKMLLTQYLSRADQHR